MFTLTFFKIPFFVVLKSGVLWLYNNVLKNSNTVINRLLDMNKKVRIGSDKRKTNFIYFSFLFERFISSPTIALKLAMNLSRRRNR